MSYRIHEIEPENTPGMPAASECVVTKNGREIARQPAYRGVQPYQDRRPVGIRSSAGKRSISEREAGA